jgi:hypothetical protein
LALAKPLPSNTPALLPATAPGGSGPGGNWISTNTSAEASNENGVGGAPSVLTCGCVGACTTEPRAYSSTENQMRRFGSGRMPEPVDTIPAGVCVNGASRPSDSASTSTPHGVPEG